MENNLQNIYQTNVRFFSALTLSYCIIKLETG